jgi:hypothetical protein
VSAAAIKVTDNANSLKPFHWQVLVGDDILASGDEMTEELAVAEARRWFERNIGSDEEPVEPRWYSTAA